MRQLQVLAGENRDHRKLRSLPAASPVKGRLVQLISKRFPGDVVRRIPFQGSHRNGRNASEYIDLTIDYGEHMGKKKPNLKREPNGRSSRRKADVMSDFVRTLEADTRDTLAPALTVRNRMFGVLPHQTRDQKAGSAIGRYCLQGSITTEQYDAATMFLESHTRNLLAIDAPRQPGAVDLNATHGRPVIAENADQLRKWRSEYQAALAAIQVKQNEIRLMGNLYGALYAVVIRDVMLEHLLGDTRTALNALVRHYGLMARAAA